MSDTSTKLIDTLPGKPGGKLCIGLTGGIGCGKSTVAALLQKLGACIIDSDAISHQLTQAGGAAIEPIRNAFGADYIDASGALDRVRMRHLIFSDNAAKKRLEDILHPLIRTQMLAQIQATTSNAPYFLLVIPLLFETASYQKLIQRSLVVDCTEATQIARTMQRSGMNEQEVRAIMAQQIARTERLRLANDIISNDKNLDALLQQAEALHQSYMALSTARD
jgi:dephospho-CoA kinase